MELINETALAQRILSIIKKGPTDFGEILDQLDNIQATAIHLCLEELEGQGLISEVKLLETPASEAEHSGAFVSEDEQKFISKDTTKTLEKISIPQRYLISSPNLMILEKFLFEKMAWVPDIVSVTQKEYPNCSRELIVSILEDFNI